MISLLAEMRVFKAASKIQEYKVDCTSFFFFLLPHPPPTRFPVSVMVAGMCVMVGLKGQALVIVPWSWLSDTTTCLLFTPGTLG